MEKTELEKQIEGIEAFGNLVFFASLLSSGNNKDDLEQEDE